MDKNDIEAEDIWLTKLFKDVGIILSKTPAEAIAGWTNSSDFHVMRDFLVRDVAAMKERLERGTDDDLYYVCYRIANIVDWIKLISTSGFPPTFTQVWEKVFDEQFGDKNILQNMYDTCFERWIAKKAGQHQIGDNFYTIIQGKLYYRDRFGKWFEVDRKTSFDLKPNKEIVEDGDTLTKLNSEYKETPYDRILRRWNAKQYSGTLAGDFLEFGPAETTPEDYFNFTLPNIKTLIKNPISITELERWNGSEIVDLEHIIKISARALDIVKKRRQDDSHTVYLLRDCLILYELHKTLDILEGEDTSAEQLLIGRKLLSHRLRDWGYYAVIMEVLYQAHRRYPDNFNEFYNEFVRLMDMFFSLDPEFAAVINNLASYIKGHIATDKSKIVIFDIGFQGSINLLTKYIIDRNIVPMGPNGTIKVDISVGVGALWSQKLFGHRYQDDYFAFLNHFQLAARSDELYHYKPGSINSGRVEVLMGDKKFQHRAAVELIILVMVTLVESAE